jgi:hypothetical protein
MSVDPSEPTSTEPSGETPSIPTPGEPSFSDFANLMKDAMKPPAEKIAAGVAPATTDVAIKPVAVAPGSQYTLGQVVENYNDLRYCASMAQLWAGILDVQNRITRKHPQPYSITDPTEALIAFADQADAAWDAMMGPMAGFYTFDDIVKSQYDKTVSRADIHAEFFGTVFAGFGFADTMVAQLDTILKTFVDAMSGTSVEVSDQAQTFNHVLRVHAMDKVTLVEDPTNPVIIYNPVTTLVYLRVDVNSWKVSIGKFASAEHVNFKFDYDVVRCSLNVDWFNQKKDTFDKMMEMVTEHNLSQFANAVDNQVNDTRDAPGGGGPQPLSGGDPQPLSGGDPQPLSAADSNAY